MTAALRTLHWDNCKVIFDRDLAFRYVWRALRVGHDTADIVKCYETALHECHALATNRTAHRGYISRFELSSTVSRARKSLEKDGLSSDERVRQWYERHRMQTH